MFFTDIFMFDNTYKGSYNNRLRMVSRVSQLYNKIYCSFYSYFFSSRKALCSMLAQGGGDLKG